MSQMTTKQNLWQMLKFVMFSAGAGIIQVVSFAIIYAIVTGTAVNLDNQAGTKDPYYLMCYLPSLILSVLYNFTVNRRYTFKSATNVPKAMLKVLGYYLIFTPLSMWWGDYFTRTLHWNDFLVLAFTMITNLVTEYLFCRFVVYRDSMNTNSLAK